MSVVCESQEKFIYTFWSNFKRNVKRGEKLERNIQVIYLLYFDVTHS